MSFLPQPNTVRCPKCHARSFAAAKEEAAPGLRALNCTACGEEFALCDGVPYLGGFDFHDAAFLIESIVATRPADGVFRAPSSSSAPKYRGHKYFDLIESAWSGNADAEAQVQSNGLEARKTELLLSKGVMAGIDFTGLSLLDVGAGTGTDAYLFHRAGAKVTALEPNLNFMASGCVSYPELTWIGGSADALPLEDQAMDVVTANASLHHHLSIHTSFDEMTRVLKTGGWMLTIGDSFKGSADEPVVVDWEQFDTHPAVLKGVNEQILRLDVVLQHLKSYGGVYEGHVYVREGRDESWRIYTLEEAEREVKARPRMWGIMALRLRKVKDLTPKASTMRRGPLSTLALVKAARGSLASALAALAKLLPASDIRTHLPLDEVSRLLQLNGWRWPRPKANSRFAYERGRLFLRRQSKDRHAILEFAVPPIEGIERATIACEVDGVELRREEVLRGVWYQWCLELPPETSGADYCYLQIQLITDRPRGESLDPARHFEVRQLTLSEAAVLEQRALAEHSTISSLLELTRPNRITLSAGPQTETVLKSSARVLSLGVPSLEVMTSDLLWSLLSWQPRFVRRHETVQPGELLLLAGHTEPSASPSDNGNTWHLRPDGVVSRLGATDWPSPQLVPTSAFDEERKRLQAKLTKSEAKTVQAQQRADKFKEKYEATKKPKSGWIGKMLGR